MNDPADFPQTVAGSELAVAGDGTGQAVQDHGVPGLWAKVTAAPVSGRHPFVQVARKAAGDGWDDQPPQMPATFGTTDASGGPLRTADGSTLPVGTIVYAVQDPAHPDGPGWLAVGGAAGGEKVYVRITAGADPGPYTGNVAVQTAPGVFADATPTVTLANIYRRPSNLGTPDIQAFQHAEVWPSPTVPGTYECHPWGAMIELSGYQCVIHDIVFSCDPGGAGLKAVITYQALTTTIRTRDMQKLNVTWEPCPGSSSGG